VRDAHPDWHAAPVPALGPAHPRLLVVGLAPGLRGANRTGLPFVGDDAGTFLFEGLHRAGFAARPDGDAPRLRDCRITNAVRCLPPENRPTPAERRACAPYLLRDLGGVLVGGRRRRPVAILTLGALAHASVLHTLGIAAARLPFAHGAQLELGGRALLVASYHPSRYNTRTRRLTESMFDSALARVRRHLDG
jgi:uracil-DNA glycosylase family 4